MKKSLKRLLCLVLSVLLFTMSLPVLAVDATEEPMTTETVEEVPVPTKLPAGMNGTGQKNAPFELNSKEDLLWFAEQVNEGYNQISAKLTADINLNENLTFSANSDGTMTLTYNGDTMYVSKDGTVSADGRRPQQIINKIERQLVEWTPIGKHTEGETNDGFCGVFDAYQYDGNGNVIGNYTISGIYINSDDEMNEVGLFGHVGNATILGVRVQNSYIRGNDAVGGIVGYAHHGATIRGCWNANGTIVSGVNNVGGVVGKLDTAENNTNIEDLAEQDHIYECINRGYVYGETNVGGILGYGFYSIVKYSANMHADTDGNNNEENYTGYVVGENYVGGIVGRAISTVILGCTNYATVQATGDYVGGIVGQIDRVKSYVRKAVNYNTASVTGVNYVGGLVGYFGEAEGVDVGTPAKLDLFTAYNNGTVTGTAYVGGLVGYNAARGQIRNSYSSGAVTINGENTDTTTITDMNGNLVGVNAGLVRDCFYYPDLNLGTTNAIGNGIGSESPETSQAIHVSGIKKEALTKEAPAYLLNLVYLGEVTGAEGEDAHQVGYHHLATHDFGETPDWDTPTYWTTGAHGPEFTTVKSKATKAIKGAQLVLNENFNITFKVDVPAGLDGAEIFTDRKVEFVRYGLNDEGEAAEIPYDILGENDIIENGGAYYFTIKDIKPHYLGDDIEVVFTANYAIPTWNEETDTWDPSEEAITVSEKATYSVKAYCERQLARSASELGYINDDGTTNEDAFKAFRTLLCNVLEYGAEYQLYRNYKTDALVNAILTEEFKTTYHKNYSNLLESDLKVVGTANSEFRAYNTAVRFGSANELGLIVSAPNLDAYPENLVLIEVTNGTGEKKSFTKNDLYVYGSSYIAFTNLLNAYEYGEKFVFMLYPPILEADGYVQGDTVSQTVTYSMKGFVYDLSVLENDSRTAHAVAMWNYGCAVNEYLDCGKIKDPDIGTGGDISLDTDNIFDEDVWAEIKKGSEGSSNTDTDGDGVPDNYVKLNISAELARLLSYFNPILSWLFDFTIVEYPTSSGVYYAAPN